MPPLVLVEGTATRLGVVNNSVSLSFIVVNDSPEVELQNIQWSFNGTVLNNVTTPSDPRYSFSNDLMNLTIRSLQHMDEGLYTLTATNEAGTNSSSVNLQIEGI